MAQTTRPTLDSLQAQINALAAQLATKQNALTAGPGISISNGAISVATGGITGDMLAPYMYINSELEFANALIIDGSVEAFGDIYFWPQSSLSVESGYFSVVPSGVSTLAVNSLSAKNLSANNLSTTNSLTVPIFSSLPFASGPGQVVYTTNDQYLWYSIPNNQYYPSWVRH
jgi:hypothetical protein